MAGSPCPGQETITMKRFASLSLWLGLILLAVCLFHGGEALADPGAGAAPGAPLLAFGFISLRGLFTREAIIRYLTQLPVLETPVMDSIFVNRPTHPLPMIGADLVKSV